MASRSEISFVRSLATRKGRQQSGMFVAEGRKIVSEAIGAGIRPAMLYGTEEYRDWADLAVVPYSQIEKMSSLRNPQGILAVLPLPTVDPSGFGDKLSLYLDGIQDPGNLGTILRIADWFGIRKVACSPDSADAYNPKAVQASMGSVLRTDCIYEDPAILLKPFRDNTTPVYGTFLDGEDVGKVDIQDPDCGVIVLGNEGSGIRDTTAGFISCRLFIPPYGASTGAESLNVSAAAAIICHEFRSRTARG